MRKETNFSNWLGRFALISYIAVPDRESRDQGGTIGIKGERLVLDRMPPSKVPNRPAQVEVGEEGVVQRVIVVVVTLHAQILCVENFGIGPALFYVSAAGYAQVFFGLDDRGARRGCAATFLVR